MAQGSLLTSSRGGDDLKPNSADACWDMPSLGAQVESQSSRAAARLNRPAKNKAMFNSNCSYISNGSIPIDEGRPSTHTCARRECLCGLPEPGYFSEEDVKKNRRKNMRVVLLCKRETGAARISIHAKRYTRNLQSFCAMRSSLATDANEAEEPRRKNTGYLNRGASAHGKTLRPKLAMMRLRNAIKADTNAAANEDPPSESEEEPEELKLLPAVASAGAARRETQRMSVLQETHFPRLPEDSDTVGQRMHMQIRQSRSVMEDDGLQEPRYDSKESNATSSTPERKNPRTSITELPQAGRARFTITTDAEPKAKYNVGSDDDAATDKADKEEDQYSPACSFVQAWNKRHTLKTHQIHNNVSKMPLDERMRRLEGLRQIQQRKRAQERQNEIKRRKFENLPSGESECLRRSFEFFDRDGNGYLDRDEAILCLKELGIWGVTPQERNEILDTCTEASSWATKGNVDEDEQAQGDHAFNLSLLDFALSVVPRVRQKLMEMRSTSMLREFFKFDDDENGHLSKQECAEVARCMGIDKRIMDATREKPTSPNGYDDHNVDFESFQVMIAKGKEKLNRLVCMRERAIQKTHSLPEGLFNDLREDIIGMHQLFCCYDADDSGSLNLTELLCMLKELGLLPKSLKDRAEVTRLLTISDVDGNGEANFSEFLDLVKDIRTYWTTKKREEHLQHFEKYDREKRGLLAVNDFSSILADLGLVPMNRREQDELAKTIKSMDQDGGYINLEQFQHIAQRVNERLQIFRYEEEMDCAIRAGFTEKQMRDLRFVFDSLDVDGSGKLDLAEVRNAFTMLRKHPSQEALEASFKSLDSDHSGELEFKEFLSLMQLMRDGEGVFADEQQRLAIKVKSLDCRVLRRCLDFFKLSRAYLNSLQKEELVMLFCDYVGVSENANLQEVLGTNTIGDLYRCVESKAQALELRYL